MQEAKHGVVIDRQHCRNRLLDELGMSSISIRTGSVRRCALTTVQDPLPLLLEVTERSGYSQRRPLVADAENGRKHFERRPLGRMKPPLQVANISGNISARRSQQHVLHQWPQIFLNSSSHEIASRVAQDGDARQSIRARGALLDSDHQHRPNGCDGREQLARRQGFQSVDAATDCPQQPPVHVATSGRVQQLRLNQGALLTGLFQECQHVFLMELPVDTRLSGDEADLSHLRQDLTFFVRGEALAVGAEEGRQENVEWLPDQSQEPEDPLAPSRAAAVLVITVLIVIHLHHDPHNRFEYPRRLGIQLKMHQMRHKRVDEVVTILKQEVCDAGVLAVGADAVEGCPCCDRHDPVRLISELVQEHVEHRGQKSVALLEIFAHDSTEDSKGLENDARKLRRFLAEQPVLLVGGPAVPDSLFPQRCRRVLLNEVGHCRGDVLQLLLLPHPSPGTLAPPHPFPIIIAIFLNILAAVAGFIIFAFSSSSSWLKCWLALASDQHFLNHGAR
mmetsp:Transcript_5372/g.13443  ORF Transcript_5372/g.13443 Transcript_5372/m.13443 type:complete len:505 (+) Transcript_5372:295-1809(+)